ncbi:MAG: signal peptidase II [Armatimonadota bacterium]|nr:signal peptidase II [Armatimonadota bacterium]MCX7776866.1 signal peptidase II [Armatimonadota bacterium]MDW8024448.1 signal peptidase II [Armatimonadota bacterium]
MGGNGLLNYSHVANSLGAALWRWICALAISAATVAVDQLSKALVCSALPVGKEIVLIEGVLHLKHVRNYGIAFGLAHDIGDGLILLSILCLAAMLLWGRHMICEHVLTCVAFGLMFGGGIGNTLDRFFRGSVVDFIDLRVWPIFNIADISLTIGTLGIIAMLLVQRMRKQKPVEPC